MRGLASFLGILALFCAAMPAHAQQAGLPARLEALEARGNAEAAYHLGMIYHVGLEGVAVDHRRALDLFRRSAAGGDALGAYKLGCYYAGQARDALAPDEALALRYKLVAAEAGYVLAQMDVAAIYAHRGDREQALRWYEAAARQGDWTALFMASFQVRPGSPRAWLFFRIIDRTLDRIVPSDAPEDEMRRLREARVEMRRHVEAGLGAADRAEGERMLAAWRVERSPVTLRADQGLNAARRLVGLPEAPAGGST
jgi:TPR repeat protein